MATDKIIAALESGARRLRHADGSETEFNSPKENIEALKAVEAKDAAETGTRRRVTRVHLKSGW